MISKEEASIIAHEHIEGYILQDYCDEIRSSSSYFPIFWQFTIYHRDQDKNVFETIICISNKGVVTDWEKRHINEEI